MHRVHCVIFQLLCERSKVRQMRVNGMMNFRSSGPSMNCDYLTRKVVRDNVNSDDYSKNAWL